MVEYLRHLNHILINGEEREDRTGVGTKSIFGLQMRFDLRKEFPAVTTKRLAWRAVVSELIWFLEGSGDERRLAEILHGTRDTDKKTIWTANAEADYWKPNAKYDGDLGRVYGVQWRNWRTAVTVEKKQFKGIEYSQTKNSVDQVTKLISDIKQDPTSRRHILTAWNPGELDDMALPPCHVMSQFYVNNGELSCQMYQRSADMFLGVPFNIASYSLLTHMIAHACDLKVGDFVHTIGDAHIYNDHVDQVVEQMGRKPLPGPTLKIECDSKDIFDIKMEHINLINYQSHPPISAPMAV
jgi:thymidylate synthase